MLKPSVFIGSSSEGLEFAKAARAALDDVAEVTLWNEEFFEPARTYIESLVSALPRFDFAVLVVTYDDVIVKRDRPAMGPRDNVIFELGLFMGHLGRSRTFVLEESRDGGQPQGDDRLAAGRLAMPSDLAGVTTAKYHWPRADESRRAAVGAACDQIRRVIRDLGVSERKAGKHIAEIASRQDAVESQIQILQLLVKGLITEPEFDKLNGLGGEGPYRVWFHHDMMTELKHLDAIRYVQPRKKEGLNAIYERDGKAEEFDLKEYLYVTEDGHQYLRNRAALFQSAEGRSPGRAGAEPPQRQR